MAPSIRPYLDSGYSGSREEGNGYQSSHRSQIKAVLDLYCLYPRQSETHPNFQTLIWQQSRKGRSHTFRSLGPCTRPITPTITLLHIIHRRCHMSYSSSISQGQNECKNRIAKLPNVATYSTRPHAESYSSR